MDVKQLIKLQGKTREAVRAFDDKKRGCFPPKAFCRLILESHPQGFVFEWIGMQQVFEDFLQSDFPAVYEELKTVFKEFEVDDEG